MSAENAWFDLLSGLNLADLKNIGLVQMIWILKQKVETWREAQGLRLNNNPRLGDINLIQWHL